MRFKAGVEYDIEGVVRIMMAGEEVYGELGEELTVTSLMDGTHMEGSKHYIGDAADFRTWMFDEEQIMDVARRIRKRLGPDYDVVVHKTHIHVEYDEK